tara:strand:+ start:679 stop:1224 length:546 start_codon:yes stop_codon:yes gene_type:complete
MIGKNNLFKKIIKTNRLILRPMDFTHSEIIVKWRNSSHVAEMNRKSQKKDLTIEDHENWLKGTRDLRVDYIIELIEKQKIIGSVSFIWEIDKIEDKIYAEMGNYIGEVDELRKGYGKESLIAWIDYGFKEFKLDKIFAYINEINKVNLKIYHDLNFKIKNFSKKNVVLEKKWLYLELIKKK